MPAANFRARPDHGAGVDDDVGFDDRGFRMDRHAAGSTPALAQTGDSGTVALPVQESRADCQCEIAVHRPVAVSERRRAESGTWAA